MHIIHKYMLKKIAAHPKIYIWFRPCVEARCKNLLPVS